MGLQWNAISFSYPTNTLESRNENTVKPKNLRMKTSINFGEDLEDLRNEEYIPQGTEDWKKVRDLKEWGARNSSCHLYLGPSRCYILGVWCRNLIYTTFRSFLAEGIAIEWQAKAKIRKVENAFIVTLQMSSTIWLSFEHCAITLLLQDYDLNNINRWMWQKLN